jgi:hypothetical protein
MKRAAEASLRIEKPQPEGTGAKLDAVVKYLFRSNAQRESTATSRHRAASEYIAPFIRSDSSRRL